MKLPIISLIFDSSFIMQTQMALGSWLQRVTWLPPAQEARTREAQLIAGAPIHRFLQCHRQYCTVGERNSQARHLRKRCQKLRIQWFLWSPLCRYRRINHKEGFFLVAHMVQHFHGQSRLLQSYFSDLMWLYFPESSHLSQSAPLVASVVGLKNFTEPSTVFAHNLTCILVTSN